MPCSSRHAWPWGALIPNLPALRPGHSPLYRGAGRAPRQGAPDGSTTSPPAGPLRRGWLRLAEDTAALPSAQPSRPPVQRCQYHAPPPPARATARPPVPSMQVWVLFSAPGRRRDAGHQQRGGIRPSCPATSHQPLISCFLGWVRGQPLWSSSPVWAGAHPPLNRARARARVGGGGPASTHQPGAESDPAGTTGIATIFIKNFLPY